MKPPTRTSTAETSPSARTRLPNRFNSKGTTSPATTRPPQKSRAKWPVVSGCAAAPSSPRKSASTSTSTSIEYRSATSILCHASPTERPVTNMISATAAIPVEAPEARKSAPMSLESPQNGIAELLSSTPVYPARKKPNSIPTSEIRRRSCAVDSDEVKDSTDDTKANAPKIPTAQAPIDIGSQNLKCRIMFMKRLGTPRSAISSTPQMATSGSESRYPTRATAWSRRDPKLSAMAPVKYAPPAIPPRKKYQTIDISQPGILSIYAPPFPRSRNARSAPTPTRTAEPMESSESTTTLRCGRCGL